ncbi:hypothetical protein U1708_05865 [Sphingomonas sp. ZB1N12]|uniref:hypothetical protein n=1 Tax=Sphingomonas arabinosi TaxID=3096160 RepID=UPI002FC5DFBC
MEITHAHLQETVKEQIDSYVVPEHHPGAIGSAMPRSWFSDRLDEMRAAVVFPVPVRMHDVDDKTGDLVTLNVLIVVDDKQGTLVAYDPESCDFVLANYALEQGHTRPLEAASTGVRGSAVDCYLAA